MFLEIAVFGSQKVWIFGVFFEVILVGHISNVDLKEGFYVIFNTQKYGVFEGSAICHFSGQLWK